MSIREGIELNVVSASWVSGYVLEIAFSDGFSRAVDFGSFLRDSVQSGIRKYLDIETFKGFAINFGNLMWSDYDLCFSIENLYSGQIQSMESTLIKVAEGGPEYRVNNKANS